MGNFKNDGERKVQVMNTELNIKSLPNQMTSEDFRQHEIKRKRQATSNTSTGTYLCLYYTKVNLVDYCFTIQKPYSTVYVKLV